ncbi:hypothetical protein Kisp01_23300 [Kineosporia sp. NBRC 101677]|nr:hypothetical protein Kisp01_23300 [Kineosporia sp. NBRC 101677]
MQRAIVGTWSPAAIPGFTPTRSDSSFQDAGITFTDDGAWKESDGCNKSTGTYRIDPEGTFTWTPPRGTTRIGCANVPNLRVLEAADSARIEGGDLVFESGTGPERTTLGRYYWTNYDQRRPADQGADLPRTALADWPCSANDTRLYADPKGTRPDLTGQSLNELRRFLKQHGNEVRVLGEDGDCHGARTDDLSYLRVNVFVRDNEVVWASVF